MDAKITKQRLSRMLSYDWLKIVGLAAALIIVWTLVFTMTATRITSAQQFTVINHMNNLSFSNTKFNSTYNDMFEKGNLSYEVLETNYTDLATSGEYAWQVLEARLAVGEGDVMFVADTPDKSTAYEEDGVTKYKKSYLETFVGSRWGNVARLDGENGYFAKMEAYLNAYYHGDYQNGVIDEAKIKSDFRVRIKANKDKRYKKESQIQAGEQLDIERIQKYRDGLVKFNGYLQKGYIEFTEVEVLLSTGVAEETVDKTGVYAINLCPDVETMGNLKDTAAYLQSYIDEATGEEKYKSSAENMNILFFKTDVEEGFEYENVLYVNYLVETYCTELNNK